MLTLVCVVLIAHGSLYPWNLVAPASFGDAFSALMAQRRWQSSFGDVVGNIALFVPLGVLWVAASPPGEGLRWRGLLPMLVAALVFAWLLQVLQIYAPPRDPALADVVWNGVGVLLGVALAALLRAPLARLAAQTATEQRPALVLVALWLALEWFPFVPTIDWQHVKDALKPLLLQPSWHGASFADATLGVFVLVLLLRPWRARAVLLIALVALAAFGKLGIVGQTMSLSHATGFVAGLLGAPLVWRLAPRRADVLGVVAILVWYTVDALRPFDLAEVPSRLHWIPFTALLEGSLTANVVAFGRAVFWLGAVLVLGGALGARVGGLALALSVWALLLEGLQTQLPGRIADATVALIPWLWLPVLAALGAGPPPRAPIGPVPSRRRRRRHR
jgi:VanZ family protein